MSALIQDLRYGVRLLLRSPGFTAVAVLALALGIGANTAIFSVVHAILLKPLPYQDPDRLVLVWERNIPRDRKTNVVSPGNYLAWRDRNDVFSEMSALSGVGLPAILTGSGDPEELSGQLVNESFFRLLGIPALVGRHFTPEEDAPQNTVVIISHRLWQRRYGSDRSIVGRAITVNGTARTVVGVMPPGFHFMDRSVDLWVPVGFRAEMRVPRGRWLIVLARLKEGVDVGRAQANMEAIAAALTNEFPEFNTGWTANVVPLSEQMTGQIRRALIVLAAAVGFVLLIACANVANLLLSRATARHRELALRAALGAGRGRLARQLLIESLMLAAAGGAAGFALAWWAVRVLRVVAADRVVLPRLETVGIDPTVLLFTVAVSLASGLIFGAVPSFSASRLDLSDALKDGGRTGASPRGRRARHAFVIAEIALALVLLAGAGLLIRSFLRLTSIDPGFDAARVLTMSVAISGPRYADDGAPPRFFSALLEDLERRPGVRAAGATSSLPMGGIGFATSCVPLDRPSPAPGLSPTCDVRVISGSYFRTLGIPVRQGRLFNADEHRELRRVAIVNESLARQFWPNGDAIGKQISLSWNDPGADEIVGVVGDVRPTSLDVEARGMVYYPHPRTPYRSMTVALKAEGRSEAHAATVVDAVRSLDPNVPVSKVRTMDEVLARSVAERQLVMALLVVFAAVALALAAVGIYGVMAYMVSLRTQEIGIRIALGARAGQVLGLVVGQALRLAAAGLVVGLAGAYFLTGLMATLLYQVTPTDPLTFAAVVLGLGAVAVAASAVPGLRAVRVDPAIALRAE